MRVAILEKVFVDVSVRYAVVAQGHLTLVEYVHIVFASVLDTQVRVRWIVESAVIHKVKFNCQSSSDKA